MDKAILIVASYSRQSSIVSASNSTNDGCALDRVIGPVGTFGTP